MNALLDKKTTSQIIEYKNLMPKISHLGEGVPGHGQVKKVRMLEDRIRSSHAV